MKGYESSKKYYTGEIVYDTNFLNLTKHDICWCTTIQKGDM